jgi:hypothetical protein
MAFGECIELSWVVHILPTYAVYAHYEVAWMLLH